MFCDDFEDGNTVGWTPNGGTWSVITDGSRVYQGGNGNSMSLAGPAAWTDQTVTARVKVLQFGGTSTSYRAGIVARATSTSNLYVFAIDASGALRLLKGTSSPASGDGASGTCGKVTPDSGRGRNTWYTMQIRVVGTGANVLITTFFNGTMIHDCQTSVGTLPVGRGRDLHLRPQHHRRVRRRPGLDPLTRVASDALASQICMKADWRPSSKWRERS